MVRKLSMEIVIATLVFWVLITLFEMGSMSGSALAATFMRALIFSMLYAAIRIALVVFRGKDK